MVRHKIEKLMKLTGRKKKNYKRELGKIKNAEMPWQNLNCVRSLKEQNKHCRKLSDVEVNFDNFS